MTLQEENKNTELLANAIQRGEDYGSVKSANTERSFVLPTPQRAGTMTQQRCYAVDKAREIVESAKLGGL
jgi:hypothetical protein|tara:strand:+ start:252 stop:461 length:210 start_codon:yes stop_codon:yes gene_type:complete